MTTKKYKAYTLSNFREIPQLSSISQEEKFSIEVVAQVFPFKTNNYVVDELIDWSRIPNDPLYVMNFPQRDMLSPEQFNSIADLLRQKAPQESLSKAVNEIRMQLNPLPTGQQVCIVPQHRGRSLEGVQHKYRETVLFFPSQSQTCHAYCTFCFRWTQFINLDELRIAASDIEPLLQYLGEHRDVSDLLITGGDPMTLSPSVFEAYIDRILSADLPNIKTIRIGTKSLSYWPYKFLESQSDQLLDAFRKVVKSGRHLAFMAHFSHPAELQTEVVKKAIARIRETGAEIRTQAPLLRHINDDPDVWARMWRAQVNLGCIPYYMFIARNTGAQKFFSVPLVEAFNIFRDAYKQVSGICRTARGPIMSASPGKVQVLGVSTAYDQKTLLLTMLQGRNPDWIMRPFYAKYDESALWLDNLVPASGGEKFFFDE